MFKLISLSTAMMLQLSQVAGFCQHQPSFTLNGTIAGLPDKSHIAMVNGNRDTIGTTVSDGNRFTFRGKVEGADFYFLRFDSTVSQKPSNALWLENSEMTVEGNLEQVRRLKLTGSRSQRIYEAYINLSDSAVNWGSATGLVEFLNAYKDSYFAPYAINALNSFLRPLQKKEFYSSLSADVKSSKWGKKLKQSIVADSISAFLTVGNKLTDFKIRDISGKVTRVSEVIKINKLTLIDIWASWCSPCRAAIPKLKSAYDKYAGAGFQIVGISTDKKPAAWKKAVSEDQTPWVHYMDDIDMAASDQLAIVAIPAYILVNQDGIILAKYITTGNDLLNSQNNMRLTTNLESVISQFLDTKTAAR